MSDANITAHLVSDHNIEVLGRYLENNSEAPTIHAHIAPYGQVFQTLAMPDDRYGPSDIGVVWTRTESVSETFSRACYFEDVDSELAMEEVEHFADALLAFRKRLRFLFVPAWTVPPAHRGYGMLDLSGDLGLANLLTRMNLRLRERLEGESGIFLLDTERWIRAAGGRAINHKLWYAAKVPFGNRVYQEAAQDLKAALQGLLGQARKLVVVDLDNTLWGGVVGEVGWNGLTLGGHDHEGEAFTDLQLNLKGLVNRGVQLCIASKNDENVALEVFDKHPEMKLRRTDFAGWRINWMDKAENIIDLAQELDLGLNSIVFIDDNAMERGRVREALPEVFVPDWPEDPALYSTALLGLRCFDAPSLTDEDRRRASMYTAERDRRSARSNFASLDDWLQNLDISIEVNQLCDTNLPRAAQLLNKTNQMNLATRRFSEAELLAWSAGEDQKLWTFRITDRFGDYGLAAIVGVETDGSILRITDFLLSCRVMGRKVEETMIYVVIDYARSSGAKEIRAEYIATPRNAPCLNFFETSGFDCRDEAAFCWDASRPYPLPACVKVHPESLAVATNRS
jgi:FkbH-like protein